MIPIDCDSLIDLPTPCVCVDETRLIRNIETVAALAGHGGVAVRPHVKTHKSIRIAREQVARGASGITASKPAEAMVFIRAGIPAITVAYPIVDPRQILALLAAASEHGVAVRLIADSAETVHAAAAANRSLGVRTELQLKVDVGLHRCGVDPLGPGAVEIARMIADAPHLAFAGILSHAGQAYAAVSADAVRRIARQERMIMVELKARLEQVGIAVPGVSVGSTPTVLLNDGFEGITEIRPGNYVLLDRTQSALGAARPEDIAMTVLTTVIASNRHNAIIDAGSKVLSSDRGAHGADRIQGFGSATRLSEPSDGLSDPPFIISHLSEEHGFIPLAGRSLAIGETLRIVPNHACPVMNLADRFLLVQASGRRLIEPVDARGVSFAPISLG
ncbi:MULTISPECIES: alanine racemase [Acidiphilium]|uniref:alanine racemase n=1 Tax=Acidiphilium TaxID=522 RepID=UPI002580EB89|nr:MULTISPECIES: alanine racemase [Acidiphilium]HQT85748.1 alanine racemase [Acidiphilium rubrum]